MLRIITHIERVLMVSDCVIVPDFGGFVLRRRPALFTAEKNAFSPAHNEIVFNPSLNHDDGLLTESYMQMYGMNFCEAQQTLRQDLDEWKKILDDHGTVSSGRLGSFRRNEDGTLIFEPETAYYTIDVYGLTSFYMTPVGAEWNHRQPGDFPVLPQDRRSKQAVRTEAVRKASLPLRMMGRIAGIAAAAIVLFFLITPPVKEVNRNFYTAGFAPPEILTSTFSAGEGEEEKEKASPVQDITEANKPIAAMSSHPEASIEATAGAVQKTTQASAEIAIEIEDVVNRSYYVIIASFDSRSRARKFVSEVDPAECRQIGMVRSGQRIRVYAAKYDNRAEAEAYVTQLRKTEKFKTSWLYIGYREN